MGVLPAQVFSKAVVRCFGSLTLLQTKAVAMKFDTGDGTGRSDWKRFIEEVQSMARDLTYDRAPGFCQTNSLAEDEGEYVHSMLLAICETVTKHRLMLKPTFQDFDRRNEDHVSREQFMRALSMFHLLPQDGYAVDLLCKAFR